MLRQTPVRDLLTARFNAARCSSIAGIIEAGRVVVEGNERLPHGEFTHWVEHDLKLGGGNFGARTAQMFMHLARNAILANPNHWFAFPPSWRTLYELSKIRPKTRLQQLIGSGKIYPGMTREEAIELRTGRQQQPGKLIVSTIIAQLLRQSEALSDAALLRDLRQPSQYHPGQTGAVGAAPHPSGQTLAGQGKVKTFVNYYGGKWRVARDYGPPQRQHVIEPFAGSPATRPIGSQNKSR